MPQFGTPPERRADQSSNPHQVRIFLLQISKCISFHSHKPNHWTSFQKYSLIGQIPSPFGKVDLQPTDVVNSNCQKTEANVHSSNMEMSYTRAGRNIIGIADNRCDTVDKQS